MFVLPPYRMSSRTTVTVSITVRLRDRTTIWYRRLLHPAAAGEPCEL
jgi:hypothetical protein